MEVQEIDNVTVLGIARETPDLPVLAGKGGSVEVRLAVPGQDSAVFDMGGDGKPCPTSAGPLADLSAPL